MAGTGGAALGWISHDNLQLNRRLCRAPHLATYSSNRDNITLPVRTAEQLQTATITATTVALFLKLETMACGELRARHVVEGRLGLLTTAPRDRRAERNISVIFFALWGSLSFL